MTRVVLPSPYSFFTGWLESDNQGKQTGILSEKRLSLDWKNFLLISIVNNVTPLFIFFIQINVLYYCYIFLVLRVLWLVDLMAVCILQYRLLDFVVCFPAQFNFQEM